MAPFPVDSSGEMAEAVPRFCAGGTPALPGNLQSMFICVHSWFIFIGDFIDDRPFFLERSARQGGAG